MEQSLETFLVATIDEAGVGGRGACTDIYWVEAGMLLNILKA